MMFASVLSAATGVGGYWWPISDRAVLIEVDLWQFSNNPPSSASVADDIKFFLMLHYTCTGPFYGSIYWIGVFNFGHRKKYPPTVLRASGSDM